MFEETITLNQNSNNEKLQLETLFCGNLKLNYVFSTLMLGLPKNERKRFYTNELDKKIYFNMEMALLNFNTPTEKRKEIRKKITVADLVYINLLRYFNFCLKKNVDIAALDSVSVDQKFDFNYEEKELKIYSTINILRDIKIGLTYLMDFYNFTNKEISNTLKIKSRTIRHYLSKENSLYIRIFKSITKLLIPEMEKI